jgi:hypothetical protein
MPAGEKKFCTSSKRSGHSTRASARVNDWSYVPPTYPIFAL